MGNSHGITVNMAGGTVTAQGSRPRRPSWTWGACDEIQLPTMPAFGNGGLKTISLKIEREFGSLQIFEFTLSSMKLFLMSVQTMTKEPVSWPFMLARAV